MDKAIVVVGPPFEQQTVYGPFENADEACRWADDNPKDYTWILTLHSPESIDG